VDPVSFQADEEPLPDAVLEEAAHYKKLSDYDCPQHTRQPKMRRLITQKRLDKGLWASADACQHVLMVTGALFLVCGCCILNINEDQFILGKLGNSEAQRALIEVPCSGTLPAGASLNTTGLPALVHLNSCEVSGANILAQAAQLDSALAELALFRDNLPAEGLHGAWLKVHLERHVGGSWVSVQRARNLCASKVAANGVLVANFSMTKELIWQIPGSPVPLRSSSSGAESYRGGPLTSRNMQVHGSKLYSGNPTAPVEGEVRIWFSLGAASTISVLSAFVEQGAGHRQLRLWQAPSDASAGAPLAVGKISSDSASSQDMLASIFGENMKLVWSIRVLGVLTVWLGMSLMLFPNHVVPDFCGGWCCCRSMPGAVATAFTSTAASWVFFFFPRIFELAALCLLPLLAATAAGFNVCSCTWSSDPHSNQRSLLEEGRPRKMGHTSPHGSNKGVSHGRRGAALGVAMALFVSWPVLKAIIVLGAFSWAVK